MYRRNLRNLDIAVAAVLAIIGGLAAAAHLPGTITIPFGVCLFFAPGYLWSEAIISQRLPGLERAMVSVGMALILPILGGFLFFGLKISLFKSAWIGLLVVLTLLGVVAVAIQRLREAPADQRPPQRGEQQTRRGGGLTPVNASIFGLAALVGIGSVAFSVKNADAQKFPGLTDFSMTQIVPGMQSYVGNDGANSVGNPAADQSKATKANLVVTNHQGVPETYKLQLLTTKGKTTTTNTWSFTLADGQTWHRVIAFTLKNKMAANLYMPPNSKIPYRTVNNGQ